MARSLNAQNRQENWAAVICRCPRRIHLKFGDRRDFILWAFIVATEGLLGKSPAKIPVRPTSFGSAAVGPPLLRREGFS